MRNVNVPALFEEMTCVDINENLYKMSLHFRFAFERWWLAWAQKEDDAHTLHMRVCV